MFCPHGPQMRPPERPEQAKNPPKVKSYYELYSLLAYELYDLQVVRRFLLMTAGNVNRSLLTMWLIRWNELAQNFIAGSVHLYFIFILLSPICRPQFFLPSFCFHNHTAREVRPGKSYRPKITQGATRRVGVFSQGPRDILE